MDEIPFYQRPWFRSVLLVIVLLGIYIYSIIYDGGLQGNILGIAFDGLMLFLLFQICVFFYAQFILPLRTLEDRRKIVSRLWLHAGGGHGPAIFVHNGRMEERAGESEKRGPGILWLDSASAAVTRDATTFKNVLDPGVHFLGASEKIASIISLHAQRHTIGPAEGDRPFEKPKEDATDEDRKKYEAAQARRTSVRGVTRDGIEIIPNITVTFKIDARPARFGEKGSRFGFEKNAVERAARSEGINPNISAEEKRRVAWNQLPALIAVDLWREYLSRFTFDELFNPVLESLPDVPQPQLPIPPMEPPKRPLIVKHNFFASLLRSFNNSFEQKLDQLIPPEQPTAAEPFSTTNQGPPGLAGERPRQTALQIINQMIKARMAQAHVPRLDDCGRLVPDAIEISDEYKTLRERGVVVLGVSIGRLRFNPDVESQLLEGWRTNWLDNARADRDRVERLQIAENDRGRERVRLDHAMMLCQAILKENPRDRSAALKVLLRKTQADLRLSERPPSYTDSEDAALDDLLRWMESTEL